MPEPLPTTPEAEMPTDLAEAHRWITTLQRSYHREIRYRERLERQVSRERLVIDVAKWWHHARGMHIKRWLGQLKAAVVELEAREAEDAKDAAGD